MAKLQNSCKVGWFTKEILRLFLGLCFDFKFAVWLSFASYGIQYGKILQKAKIFKPLAHICSVFDPKNFCQDLFGIAYRTHDKDGRRFCDVSLQMAHPTEYS